MQYNYDFEIASLLIMAIILLHFAFIRQFPVDKTKIFGVLLMTCTAECCANILSCIGLANAAFVPQAVNEVLAFAFFVLEGLASYLLFRYFLVVCEFKDIEKKVVSQRHLSAFSIILRMVYIIKFLARGQVMSILFIILYWICFSCFTNIV